MAGVFGRSAFRALKNTFRRRVDLRTKVLYGQNRNVKLRYTIPALALIPAVHAWGWGTQKEEDKAGASAHAQKSPEQQVIEEADDLYNRNDILHLYDLLVKYNTTENDELLWRLARATCDKAKMTADKEIKKKLMFEAFDYIQKALQLNDKSFAIHKWYAILLDYTGEFEGTKSRLTKAFEVKEHFMKAVELNPADATSVHLLGYWCFVFADLPWYQRKVASVIFTSPPNSSYEEALKYFDMAEKIDPNFYSMNLLCLGKTYLRMGNNDRAKEYLLRARDYIVKTEDDKQAHQEATELLKGLGVQ